MDLFKTYLQTSEDDETLDATRHSVVILMGTLAQHLNNKDDEVRVYILLISVSIFVVGYWLIALCILISLKVHLFIY